MADIFRGLSPCESETCLVVSDSLRPHGLYNLWNSPDQDTRVGCHSLLQGIFPSRGSNSGLPHCGWILYQLSPQGSPYMSPCIYYELGFSGGSVGKESPCQCRRLKRCVLDPWVGKSPWRGKWQPTPVSLPGESHGQRGLESYSPCGCKESDTLRDRARTHPHIANYVNFYSFVYSTLCPR